MSLGLRNQVRIEPHPNPDRIGDFVVSFVYGDKARDHSFRADTPKLKALYTALGRVFDPEPVISELF